MVSKIPNRPSELYRSRRALFASCFLSIMEIVAWVGLYMEWRKPQSPIIYGTMGFIFLFIFGFAVLSWILNIISVKKTWNTKYKNMAIVAIILRAISVLLFCFIAVALEGSNGLMIIVTLFIVAAIMLIIYLTILAVFRKFFKNKKET